MGYIEDTLQLVLFLLCSSLYVDEWKPYDDGNRLGKSVSLDPTDRHVRASIGLPDELSSLAWLARDEGFGHA